ncbi:MAG: site-specific integrase [Lacipirellulaceae bacterium]
MAELLDEARDASRSGQLKPVLDEFLVVNLGDWDYPLFQRRLHRAVGKEVIYQDQIDRWADRWFETLLQSGNVHVRYVDDEPGILIDGLSRRRAEQLVESYVEDTGLSRTFETDANAGPRFRIACFDLLNAHCEADYGSAWEFSSSGLSARPGSDQISAPAAPTITTAFEKYLADAKVRPRTELDWWTACNRFVAFLEKDPPITTIRPEDVIDFRDALARFPRAVPGKLKESSFEKICEYADAFDLPRLSPKTVNKNLHALAACFGWLIKNRYARDNPARGIQATISQWTEDDRLPFSHDDLRRIFGSKYPKRSASADYWVPWLALYSGARIEELAKLKVGDVERRHDVPFIHIRGRVKNKVSVRRLPIHSALIKKGLVEHARQRGDADRLLFDDVEPDKYSIHSAKLSKRFGKYLRAVGVTDQRKVFHSFRHFYKDACRDADVPIQVQNALLGHTSKAVGEGYGQGYSVRKLSEWVEEIRFPV